MHRIQKNGYRLRTMSPQKNILETRGKIDALQTISEKTRTRSKTKIGTQMLLALSKENYKGNRPSV